MANKQLSFTPKQMELASKLTPLQRKFIIELIKPNTTYLLQIQNNGNEDDANVEIYILWAELLNKFPRSS